MIRDAFLSRWRGLAAGMTAALLGSACVTAPAPAPMAPPPPDTTVTFYPARGQSADRQDRDKYECNGWAVQQSGFDPSAPNAPPHLQVQVAAVEPPAGAGALVGAAGGAVIGSALSRPWESGQGALVGALAGAVIGGLSDAARLEQARAAADSATTSERAALLERMARDYRRAMSACLEARGYSVR